MFHADISNHPFLVFLAITPIVVSIAVAFIGWFQYQINSKKLRLDIYNRRFAVYEKALLYFQSYYSKNMNAESVDACAREFIRAYRESFFLFGEDSGVYRQLRELKDNLSFRFDFRNASDPQSSSTPSRLLRSAIIYRF